MDKILILNLPGPVLKSGSRWYNTTTQRSAYLRYYPYPWMMGYLTTLLKQNGFDARLRDAVAQEWSIEDTIGQINPGTTHLVCEPTWVSTKDDKRFLASLDRRIVKIAVGNYATNSPLECLETGVDIVVVGEYEFPLLHFFQHGAGTLQANFVTREKHSYQFPELVRDLDLFPFPERDDVPLAFYNEPSCYGKNAVMVSSRGCRLRCSFCNVEYLYGQHLYRVRSAANVVNEMVDLSTRYTVDEIYFDDDNMVSDRRHIVGICQEISRRQLKINWLCMGDGLVDDETLEWLARAGCVTYKFGLEHLDPEVLKAIPKPLQADRSLQIISRCKQLGMRCYVCLILGLPGSTRDKDMRMLERVLAANPDLIQLATATPYPGTTFYRRAEENGWLVTHDLKHFNVTGASVVSYPGYAADEITETVEAGWKMWYRHVLLHPRKTWFYVRSEVRRHGWLSTARKGTAYLGRLVSR